MCRWTVRADAGGREFLLYAPGVVPLTFPRGTVQHRLVGEGRGTWWEQTTLRRCVNRDRPDVFFAPAYTAPLGLPAPLALTIHDISFIAHPEWFRPRERWRRRIITGRSAAAARVVFTDSEFSRSELETRLGLPPNRIRVIPPGVSAPPDAKRDPSHIPEPLVLYAGSIFNRRRLPDLIAAFAKAAADVPAARLVIVGADRTWPPQDLRRPAAAHGIASRVELLKYVSDAELGTLY